MCKELGTEKSVPNFFSGNFYLDVLRFLEFYLDVLRPNKTKFVLDFPDIHDTMYLQKTKGEYHL